MKFIFANLALLALQAHMASALTPNLEESPQILSDTTDVCTTSGNRPTCEVELDVPASCVSGGQSDCPIVFFLHGSGGTNDWFARTSGVHTAGYIGIYPQGEGGWNTGPKNTNVCSWEDFECSEDPDEGAFIANIISKVRSEGANGNVYVIGNSNGAALAMRLASNAGTELPIKGIVTKVTQLLSSPDRSGPGVLNYNQPSLTSPKVSVLNVMGTGDGLIPYSGGPSGVFSGDDAFQLMDALESMIVWAEHNGCSPAPDITPGLSSDQGTGATFYDYKGCDGGTIVEHYAILGGGHGAGGASIDGEKIDYDIAFDFINRCEEGSTPVPPSVPPAPSTTTPVIAPTPAPAPAPNVCEDDPTWAGKFNAAHTCSHVKLDTDIRCNWENSDGVKASEGCPATCGTCSTPPSCITCNDQSTPWMIDNGYDCSTPSLIANNCNLSIFWVNNKYCQASCFHAGKGYGGDNCCSPCEQCTDEETPWMTSNGHDCTDTDWLLSTKCNSVDYWKTNVFCRHSCFAIGLGYDGDNCCSD